MHEEISKPSNQNQLTKSPIPDDDALFAAVAQGDLSKLTTQQKLAYYNRRCTDLGLNPLNQPFQWLLLNGKLVLYANRACTEELRANRKISIMITSREILADCYIVTAKATTPEGRTDESTGAVSLPDGLKGEARANALLKAETKAKRRVTLSICGLGLLDETEVETIPSAKTLQLAAGDYEKEFQHVLDKAEGNTSPVAAESSEVGVVVSTSAQPPEAEEIPAVDEVERYTAKLTGIKHAPSGAAKLEFIGNDGKPWCAWAKQKWADFLTSQSATSGCMLDVSVSPRGAEYEVVVIWSVKAPDVKTGEVETDILRCTPVMIERTEKKIKLSWLEGEQRHTASCFHRSLFDDLEKCKALPCVFRIKLNKGFTNIEAIVSCDGIAFDQHKELFA